MMDAGLLVARLVFGSLMFAHGAQKLFGWFGGYGLSGTGGFFESLGFRPGRVFAAAAAVSELGGGLLLVLGLAGPVGPAAVMAVMIVGAVSVHLPNGVFASSNGVELPLLYAASAAALTLTGPGAYSLDALLGLTAVSSPSLSWSALIAAVAASAANLALRKTPQVTTA
jgi:putative oxidoreductase